MRADATEGENFFWWPLRDVHQEESEVRNKSLKYEKSDKNC